MRFVPTSDTCAPATGCCDVESMTVPRTVPVPWAVACRNGNAAAIIASRNNFHPTFKFLILPPPSGKNGLQHRQPESPDSGQRKLLRQCCEPGSVASPLPGSYVLPAGRTEIRTFAAPRIGCTEDVTRDPRASRIII